ncbi:family 65 glycosyl hydrolase [Plantactinospora sp. BC1]|uniref:glycoside hydrolase family 65 protein n=1 Tax=Plantactinospora sp. BC1 TaxID=2108470 RepID=UPI000D150FBD|nr:glycosyl hydrolase family 65 protein [Plantactinospora sp. BC1]AVT34255.1 family 65 glycosyl hydrolase [Plantactinospora sp. BC1]
MPVPRARTGRPAPAAEPTWEIREEGLGHRALADLESVFALANGRLGVRGTLEEGGVSANPGTYLNSCYEEYDLNYPENGYAFPEQNQVLVGVPEGTRFRLFVDDRPVEPTAGGTHRHERVLDLRDGTLRRSFGWTAESGAAVEVRSTRLVSFVHPGVLAIRYEVVAADRPVRIRLHSELRANPALPERDSDDPRSPNVLERPLLPRRHSIDGLGGLLGHQTRRSGQRIVATVTHLLDGARAEADVDTGPDLVRVAVEAELAPGQRLRVTKLVGYASSGQRPFDELVAEATTALAEATRRGWAGLRADQRGYLDRFWDDADVVVDGDPQLQQAVRFGLFHVLQASARAGQRPLPAKGLTGNGYDGHTMWDAETFVLPVLTYLRPEAAEAALRWRHATLDRARQRAGELRLAGAAFPWRTIDGRECSGYWPAGSAALHVNADIAAAVLRYVAATDDLAFLRDAGLELLVETARLWNRVGHHDDAGGFHIDGVTGPDEYTALGNDNLFTNVMARHNLLGAVAATERLPERARQLGVEPAELSAWRRAAEAMHLPYDAERGVHQQCAGFTALQEWDFAGTRSDEYPLLLHYPYLELYRRQVIKQADVVLAMQHCAELFTREQKARNFDYYHRRTVGDSSLSASAQAIIAAELGHLELGYAHLADSALQDLHDFPEQSRDGLHVAALAGVWLALVAGFGGLRDQGDELAFAPRLPAALTRLEFSLRWRGHRLRVTVTGDSATYLLRDGTDRDDADRDDADEAGIRLRHHGTPLHLRPGRSRRLPLPALPDPGPEPPAPPSRAPRRRPAGKPVTAIRPAGSDADEAAPPPARPGPAAPVPG